MSKFKDNVSNGLCGNCGVKLTSKLSLCPECLIKNRKRQKEISNKRLLNCECRDCGIFIGCNVGLRCQNCKNKSNQSNFKRRIKRSINSQCCDCGKSLNKHKSRCDKCHNKSHMAFIVARSKRKSLGICIRCGKSKKMNDSLFCEVCYYKTTAINAKISSKDWLILKEVFDKQLGVCPYTKRKLTIGKDASLDHKIPVSKGGQNIKDNFQWIYLPINVMKLDHQECDFLDLIKEIYENAIKI